MKQTLGRTRRTPKVQRITATTARNSAYIHAFGEHRVTLNRAHSQCENTPATRLLTSRRQQRRKSSNPATAEQVAELQRG